MTFQIELDEGTAARRRVPFRVFTSDGTSPETGFSDATVLHSINGGAQATSSASASAVSANAGQYYVEFTAAEVGTLGTMAVYTDKVGADFEQHVANVNVVNNNLMSLLSAVDYSAVTILGVSGRVDSDVTVADADYSAVTVRAHSSSTIAGTTNVQTQITALHNIDGSKVTLHAGTHSAATIKGIENYANISDVTLHAGTHSDVTIQGVTRLNSGITLNADSHSGATIKGIENYANISNVTLHAGTHSDATIQGVTLLNSTVTLSDGGLRSVNFAAGAVDAAALATDAGQEIADRVLARSVVGGADSGRSVGQALAALRNRVRSDDTQVYVYLENDSDVMWTSSIVTVDSTAPHISEIDPD